MDDTARLRRKLVTVIREFNDGFPGADDQIRCVIGPADTTEKKTHELLREGTAGAEGALLSHKNRDFSAELCGLTGRSRIGWSFDLAFPFPEGTKFPIDDPRLYFNLVMDHHDSVKFSVAPDGEGLALVDARIVIPMSALNADSLLDFLIQLHFAAEHVPIRLSGNEAYHDWWDRWHRASSDRNLELEEMLDDLDDEDLDDLDDEDDWEGDAGSHGQTDDE